MMKNIFAALLFLGTLSAFAGTNLLDLLKAGKAAYGLGTCQTFIQAANHQTLVSSDLQKLVVKAKNSRFVDDYYFHYSNAAVLMKALRSDITDRAAAQSEIIKSGGYQAILQYQMTYSDALSNVSGVGFYIAANPFSSQNYGNNQVALRVDPNANLFDAEKYADEYKAALRKIIAQYPAFNNCNDKIQFSLMMNENNIDLALYNVASEWLVVFNEDIFTQSRISYVGTSASANAVMAKLVSNGDGAAVIEYIKDLGLNKTYAKISMDDFFKMLPAGATPVGQNLIVQLAETLKNNWSDTLKLTFAKLVATRSGAELNGLMDDLAQSGLVPKSTYYEIPFTGTSADFLRSMLFQAKVSSAVAKSWKGNFEANVVELLKQNMTDLDFVMKNYPPEFNKDKFFKSYKTYGFSKPLISDILEYMVYKDSSLFTALDKETRYVVFNDYLANSGIQSIPAFTAAVDQLGYDGASSFSYVTRKSSQFGANGLAFLVAYFKLKKDPALLTDSVLALILTNKTAGMDLLTYLKQNKAAFGASVSKFSDAFISKQPVADLDDLIKPSFVGLLDKADKDFILGRILQNEDASTAVLIPKFIQTFSYSQSDLLPVMKASSPLASSPGLEAIKFIQKDASAWANFIDLKNQDGMLAILKQDAKAQKMKNYLVDSATDSLLLSPENLPSLDATTMKYILDSTRSGAFVAKYNDSQKFVIAQLMKKYDVDGSKDIISTITFTAEMVQNSFTSILSGSSSVSDLEDILNNPSYISLLSDRDFQRLVTSITGLRKKFSAHQLINSDALTVSKATILAFALERENGVDNMDEILKRQLDFDSLSPADQAALLTKYQTGFTTISMLSKTRLWPVLFNYASSTKKDQFVDLFSSMTVNQANDLLAYYSSSDALITKALALFRQNNQSYIEETLDHDQVSTVTNVLKFIEANYPLHDEPYALHMINSYDQATYTGTLQVTHMQNFVCKKVKKFYAFDNILDNTKDKEVKKALKEKRKRICL